MSAAAEIARLDRDIARKGQDFALKRGSGTAFTMRGFMRGYEVEKVVGLITLADRMITVSATGLAAWMVPNGLPRNADQVSIAGRLGAVQEAEPIYYDGTLVRVNMRVRLT